MATVEEEEEEAQNYEQIVAGYKAQISRLQKQKTQLTAEKAEHEASAKAASEKIESCSGRIGQIQSMLRDETEDRMRQIQWSRPGAHQSTYSAGGTTGRAMAAGSASSKAAPVADGTRISVSGMPATTNFVFMTHGSRNFFDPAHEDPAPDQSSHRQVSSGSAYSNSGNNTNGKRKASLEADGPANKRHAHSGISDGFPTADPRPSDSFGNGSQYPTFYQAVAGMRVHDAAHECSVGAQKMQDFNGMGTTIPQGGEVLGGTPDDTIKDPDFKPGDNSPRLNGLKGHNENFPPNLGLRRPTTVGAGWYRTDEQWEGASRHRTRSYSHAGRMMEVEGFGVVAQEPCANCASLGQECIVYPVEYQFNNGRRCAYCRWKAKAGPCRFPGGELEIED